MEDLIGDLTAVPQPIEIKLFSDDGKLLRELAPKVAEAIEKVRGRGGRQDGIVLAGDALDIHVDREKAALEGMDPDAVTEHARRATSKGTVTTQVQRGPKMVGVRRLDPRRRSQPATRRSASSRLRAPDGHLFPLSASPRVTPVIGQPQITRDDLKRMVAVTGPHQPAATWAPPSRDVKAVLAQPGLLPHGRLLHAWAACTSSSRSPSAGLVVVLAAAVVLVFVLLLFLYEQLPRGRGHAAHDPAGRRPPCSSACG